MPVQDSGDFVDNLVTALIREMIRYSPVLKDSKPVAWDSDDTPTLPNLRVKVTTSPLIPSQPVYAATVAISYSGKPKRYSVRQLKKQVQNFVEDTELGDFLTDAHIHIATNAEDVSVSSEVTGEAREYKTQFTLRGFRLE